MNYLGHLLLSGQDEDLLIGNFLADRLTAKQQRVLDLQYQKGLQFHRWIDQTTDRHPNIRQMARMIRPIYGRYAPVALSLIHI